MHVIFRVAFLANGCAGNLTFESPKRATLLQHEKKGRKTQEKIFCVIAFKSTAELLRDGRKLSNAGNSKDV